MCVACISLAVALSGAGYAAFTLPRGSVGTVQLKRDAVTSAKVKRNALRGEDIKEATLGRVPSATRASLLGGLGAGRFVRAGAVDAFYGAQVLAPPPSPTAGLSITKIDVTLRQPGRLLVLGRATVTVFCNAGGPCSSTYALFVDTSLVPNSQMSVGAAAGVNSGEKRLQLYGLTAVLAAGPHTIFIRTTFGATAGEVTEDRAIAAIEVG
jgi:hypothetical protein